MMKYKEDKMEQCKIKPWNIRKLHFAIDQLQPPIVGALKLVAS